MPEICDYEGSDYRQRFWTEERAYEDLAERQLLQSLLPPRGDALVELGAGFGRLTDLYEGWERICLVDYSRTLLHQARADRPDDHRFTYVAADIRRLPLAAHAFNAAVTVRVLHHLRDVSPALIEVHRVLQWRAPYFLEFASKRHLKAVVRWLARRQRWNPFDREPVEFAELNLDFHPDYMRQRLEQAGFIVESLQTLSILRVPALKRRVSAAALARVDAVVRPVASLYPLSPSIMAVAHAQKPSTPQPSDFLACPDCHSSLEHEPERVVCTTCRLWWAIADGVYDFKETHRL